jgi:hypothetical protein
VRFALVMPTWIYRPDRALLADDCFRSLMATRSPETRPALILLVRESSYCYPIEELRDAFDVEVLPQAVAGEPFRGITQPLIYGTDHAFELGADFVVHVNDDSVFSPLWLDALTGLISRHPGARAWSVYRSAHTAVHAELREEGPDVLVRSINGDGITFARRDWTEWAPDWRAHPWPPNPRDPSVLTLDYMHYLARPGERWVTRRSFMDHTGRDGTHCVPGIPEWAQDFVGRDAP